MSKTFFPRIEQQRQMADETQIARVGKGDPTAITPLTIGVLAQVFVQPLFPIFVAPVAVPSVNDEPVDIIAPVNLSTAGVTSVALEFLVDVGASISPAAAVPTVNDEAVDVIAAESPTIGVVAIIVSVT
jgi:hypothetical protein